MINKRFSEVLIFSLKAFLFIFEFQTNQSAPERKIFVADFIKVSKIQFVKFCESIVSKEKVSIFAVP